MNNCIKTGLLTIALGTVFATTDTNAAQVVYGSAANAPGRCQAFTPGVTNTIRNRVVGSENIGSSPIAVACAFETGFSSVSSNALALDLWFSNNGTSGPVDVNCTLLTGWQGASGAVAVNKSTSVVAGTQSVIFFEGDDLPGQPETLGFVVVGTNCTLPTGAVINDTYTYWSDEDGVGS